MLVPDHKLVMTGFIFVYKADLGKVNGKRLYLSHKNSCPTPEACI